jgi:sugar phosphate isomerase/epimerase
MKKGINIPHLFKLVDLKQKLWLIKQAGFDVCMPTLDPQHEVINYPIEEAVVYANKIGLSLEFGHAPYKEPDIKEFWSDTKQGDEIEKTYFNTIDIASKFSLKGIVCHLHYGTNFSLCEVGLNRLRRLANYAKSKNIIIAIENLYSYEEPTYIFSHIQHPNLKMCFDCGHENFLTPNANFLTRLHSHIVALHLHDNNGVEDEHKTPFTGSVNWNYIVTGLANVNNVALTLEVKPTPKTNSKNEQELELKQVLKEQFNALLKLEKQIIEQKNTKQKIVA